MLKIPQKKVFFFFSINKCINFQEKIVEFRVRIFFNFIIDLFFLEDLVYNQDRGTVKGKNKRIKEVKKVLYPCLTTVVYIYIFFFVRQAVCQKCICMYMYKIFEKRCILLPPFGSYLKNKTNFLKPALKHCGYVNKEEEKKKQKKQQVLQRRFPLLPVFLRN